MLCVSSALGGAKESNDKRKAKARHFYLKGAVSSSQDNYDEAYEYYKKALQIDPEYVDAAYDFGVHRLVIMEDTFTTDREIDRSLGYMRKLLDAYPKDVIAAESYAYYAMEADTLEEALRVYNILVKQHPGLSRLYFPQSFLYLNLGQPDSAIIAMNEYERLEGPTSETTVRKISYHLADHDTVGAMKEVRDYIDSDPGNIRPILEGAMIYNALNYPDSAVYLLENAQKEFPNNGDLQFDLGFLYLNQGDTARFHSLVAKALKSDYFEYEDKIEGLTMYIQKLPTKGYDFKESDALVDYMFDQYPNDAALLDLSANYYLTKGDKKKAFEMAKKAYTHDSTDPNMLGRVMSFSIIAEKPKEGMKIYEEYPYEDDKLDLGLSLTYISAAELALEYPKALEATEKMLKGAIPTLSINDSTSSINPDSLILNYTPYEMNVASAAFEVAGDVYTRLEKPEDAIRSYENSIAVPVENPSVLNNYAYYLIETIRVEPGSADFERAKQMSWQSMEETEGKPQANYLDTYAWILFKEQNYRDALEYIELALELQGDSPSSEILSHYGDILFMTGKPQEALKEWKKALELDPQNEVLKRKVDHKTFFYE